MSKFFLDTKAIQSISFFEKATGAKVKDCVIGEDNILFIVEKGEVGKAVGKQGSNIKELERAFNKRIKVVEFSTEIKTFINNLITPVKAREVVEQEGVITITPCDTKTRGFIIGRNAETLRNYEEITKRYFQIKEIKVAKI